MRTLAIASLLATLSLSAPASATVTEPNGLVVPRDSANGETQLYTFFAQKGEIIDWQKDAHTTPATFTPLCGFTAQFELHQAGSSLGFGWYNSDPKNPNPPAANAIHVIVAPGSPVGTVVKSADIVKDPNYKGGQIGFALIGGQTHYSEQRYNVDCNACGAPGPWALAVVYQSLLVPHAYYVAFEDGPVSNSGFGNDGDFNDYVFLVTGVLCSGAGAPCSTGKMGVCGDGLTNCDVAGGLECKQLNSPGLETCDGLDNDCNGMIDDGAMCPDNKVCDRGACVAQCGAGEFQCAGATACDNGVCVDQQCVGLRCPAGQVCHQGVCSAACDGVVCPNAQVCRAGRCVDPCAGVKCGMDQACAGGVCVTSCVCQPCAANLGCAKSGECVDKSCLNMNCPPGNHCKAGQCVDDCDAAVCPRGQACQMGSCVDQAPGDMGSPEDMDSLVTDDAGVVLDVDGGISTGTHGHKVGCGCALGARQDDRYGGLSILATLTLIMSIRRRRRSQDSSN